MGSANGNGDYAFLDKIASTNDVPVPERVVDQVIGQDEAVKVVKKASAQKRHVLLVGTPGTGKSMLAQAMAELLPVQELEDTLIVANPLDENSPNAKMVKAGSGRKLLENQRLRTQVAGGNAPILLIFLLVLSSFFLLWFGRKELGDIITAALLIGLFVMAGVMAFTAAMGRMRSLGSGSETDEFKLIVDNADKKTAPFIDATGSRAGSLLGDVRHDPLQSGGLGTPAHLRVEAGAIHRANHGVLFIDEVSALRMKSQQELLTALQEKKYSITGQSEMSSGALVKTAPVPCDFVLVVAGNYEDIRRMHPALRSRIRGYGYEVYMDDSIPDSADNRFKLVQFVAQEVKKDGKIPPFDHDAIIEILREARKRSGRKNRLTLKLRELGGLVRAAGDVAKEEGAAVVTAAHVTAAKHLARTAEQQITAHAIDVKREYEVFSAKGSAIGKVNGLAVIGDSGIVLPLVAEVAPASSKQEGKTVATGKLGDIAKEAVENVSAIIKKHTGKDTSNYDIHIQFLQTYEGVEGDSASVSVATAVLSAIEEIPIEQSLAMTGSLSVRGEVLPVGGITPKVEAAIEAGMKKVVIPAANMQDLVLDEKQLKKIEILPAKDLADVLEYALAPGAHKRELIGRIRRELA